MVTLAPQSLLSSAPAHEVFAEPASSANECLAELTRLNAEELVKAFKLDRFPFLRPFTKFAASRPAERLAHQMMQFDKIAGEEGLAAAGRFVLARFTRELAVLGVEHIPPHGPLLIVSNHPGMVDAMALWSGLESRNDLRVIAADRDMLRLLPRTKRYLFFVSRDGSHTMLLRGAVNHLKSGGALLTFPAGNIEPDPCIRSSSRDLRWSTSIRLFARAVPDLTVLPAAVGGVVSPAALRNPLVSLFRNPKDRDWAAATLQILFTHYRNTRTRVVFGEPLAARDFDSPDNGVLIRRVRTLMEGLAVQR